MTDRSNQNDPILTTGQAAQLLGVAISTVQLWLETGQIASWKTPGGHRRLHRSALAPTVARIRRPALTLARPDDPDFQLPHPGSFPVPVNERSRLDSLAASRLVGSEPEERFARITRLAAKATGSPIAQISLVTGRRQWAIAAVGTHIRQMPRAWSFSTHAILQDDPMIVVDAAKDERFRASPIVLAEPYVRFYAGVALRDAGGQAWGTLCIADHEPRQMRAVELESMVDLAAVAAAELRRSAEAVGPH